MTSRLDFLPFGLFLGLCVALNGCTSSPEGMAAREPAMPTVMPDASAPPASVPEDEIFAAMVRSVREKDTAGVGQSLLAIRDPSQRDRLTRRLAMTLAAEDPAVAATFATALPQGSSQAAALEIAASALVQRDREAALHWAMSLSDPAVGRLVRRAVLNESVRVDARGTIDRVYALTPGSVRDDMLVMSAAAWARSDPEAAISWLRGQADDELKQRLTSGIGFEIAQTRPDRAVAVAEMLPVGRDQWMLFSAIAQTWVAVDSKAALAWAGQLPAGESRDAALAGVTTGLGVPVSRRIAGAPGTRSGLRIRGGGAAAVPMPEIDSPGFTAWRATQMPGMSREDAILEYVRQRGALEPATMAQWISTLPGGATRDRATEIYLETIVPTSPDEAARWLRSLPRSNRSDDLIENAARRWLRTDPAAAAAWLDQTMLPSDRKERLLREAGR